ncbi:hypothetical protein B0A49_07358 [Cryomyces minteri]|uniref:Major facilitator superfamily (MFS) profile domain-containing protein n=1 Tax=Cryomyces minteri TaxID=331657 RepID=A0A4U0WQU7_9PEZI|nr:hypothetical protein B0A49_07358 [Cryomyces minteri]
MTGLFSTRSSASIDMLEAEKSPDSSQRAVADQGAVESLAPVRVPFLAYILGAIAAIGGFVFGYESGQISGFLAMSDFVERFGENGAFSAVRSGTIVGLLSAGTLIGCLISAPLADKLGRRYTISASAFFYIVGVLIEITSSTDWVQFAMGRFAAGLGIGALSTSVPMYQSESIPKAIRGAVVSSYQLAITLGIWTAYMVNYGTSAQYSNSAQWRIPNGLSALWAILLGSSILLMPESPRFAFRMGREEEARRNMARLNGVDEFDPLINQEIREIQEGIAAEHKGGDHPWYEIFTGPRMLYRTLLGMVLQAGQQLTGANFFFYYGTTIFAATGLENSYVTSIILGTVNVVSTIIGIWIMQRCGRRKSLMVGAAWMCMCFLVFSFVGHFQLDHARPQNTPQAGNLMIIFTCFFIFAFATTWGPMVWAVVAEMYPARYRAKCMALATASNWLFNFLISFFSIFITNKIDYLYGLVFAGCCLALFFVVFFFMMETKGRSLEEIDTMYVLGIDPIDSANWDSKAAGPEGGVNIDNAHPATGDHAFSQSKRTGEVLRVQNE